LINTDINLHPVFVSQKRPQHEASGFRLSLLGLCYCFAKIPN